MDRAAWMCCGLRGVHPKASTASARFAKSSGHVETSAWSMAARATGGPTHGGGFSGHANDATLLMVRSDAGT